MRCEPFRVITIAFGPPSVAPLEREDSQLAREMRSRVGDTAGDECGCHGGLERRLGLPVETVPEETFGPFTRAATAGQAPRRRTGTGPGRWAHNQVDRLRVGLMTKA
jgi:hypothetical protein